MNLLLLRLKMSGVIHREPISLHEVYTDTFILSHTRKRRWEQISFVLMSNFPPPPPLSIIAESYVSILSLECGPRCTLTDLLNSSNVASLGAPYRCEQIQGYCKFNTPPVLELSWN